MNRKVMAHLLLWLYDIAHTIDCVVRVITFSLVEFNMFGEIMMTLVCRRVAVESTRSAHETQPEYDTYYRLRKERLDLDDGVDL
jgi:hypothetical protein